MKASWSQLRPGVPSEPVVRAALATIPAASADREDQAERLSHQGVTSTRGPVLAQPPTFDQRMKTRTILTIVFLGMLVIALVAGIGSKIGGGAKTFGRVAEVLKTHRFILDCVGSPVKEVQENDGPSEVSLASDGRRNGYYSVTITGPKGKELLKAYWCELPGGVVEVYAIYRTKDFAQDSLIWGAPRAS